MKSICYIACIVMLGLALSCQNQESKYKDLAPSPSTENTVVNTSLKVMDEKEEDQQQDKEKKQEPPQTPKEPVLKPDWDKKIVKTAVLNAEVEDYNKYYASLREKVKNLGGYIAQEEQTQSDYKIENSIMVKVPVDQFDEAVVQLTANTQKINDKKITSQDVTTEVIDTKSRLQAKKQVRLRYMDLLNQAKNMQEILSVQGEINGIQEEIESAAGRIEYLGHSSAFSTIHLTYYQVLNVTAKDKEKPSFANQLGNSFSIGWNFIKDVFVGIVTIWPVMVLALAIVLIYRKTRVKKAI